MRSTAPKQLKTKLAERMVDEMKLLSPVEGADVDTLTLVIFERGMAGFRTEKAVEEYSSGEYPLRQASELAGLPPSEFIDLLIERGG